MSWQRNVENTRFQITTGDRRTWTPLWTPNAGSLDFNFTIYDFVNLPGSFVQREQHKGQQYSFRVTFAGGNHITEGNSFLESAKNPNSWQIVHPYFGDITVQPTRIGIDRSEYNVTRLSIDCIETILTDNPRTEQDITSQEMTLQSNTFDATETAYQTGTPNPSGVDQAALQTNISLYDRINSAIIENTEVLAEYKRRVSIATNNALELGSSIVRAIRTVNDVINFPARIAQNVRTRFNAILEALNTLTSNLSNQGLDTLTRKQKVLFMVNGVSLVSTACTLSIVQPSSVEILEGDEDSLESLQAYNLNNDYPSRVLIVQQMNMITSLYNNLLAMLETVTTDRNDSPDDFAPDPVLMGNLSQQVVFTLSNLQSQIFQARQERSIVLQDDSNLINITNSLIGLNQNDSNIQTIIDLNGFSLDNILQLKKGTNIIYYA